MHISVAEAGAQLPELVRLVEAGETVTLTRFGQPVVQLLGVERLPDAGLRRALLERLHGQVREAVAASPTAAPRPPAGAGQAG